MNAFTFRKRYLFFALSLFIIEVLIALFFHDRFVRPYVGDFLVVILIYCFIRSFFAFSVRATAIATLLLAYLIEFLQYADLLHKLGLQHSALANLVLGNLFQWGDLIAYTLGIVLVLILERKNTG